MLREIDLFFLNPSISFENKIVSYFSLKGFIRIDAEKKIYRLNNKQIELVNGYSNGDYIELVCTNISPESVCELLKKCPECGSSKIKPSILHCWKNDLTEQAYIDGLLDYGPGAYDRLGTRPQTRTCIKCGCKWYNSEDMFIWNNEIRNGNQLTNKILGIPESDYIDFL